MKYVFSFVIILFTLQSSFAQEKPIMTLERGYIKSDNKVISVKHALQLMAKYPEALAYMKGAKSDQAGAQVLGAIGGGLIGFPVGTQIAGGDPNWTLAGIGAVFILASIPFIGNYKQKAQIAIKLYNESGPQAYRWKPKIRFGVSETGLGLRLSF